MTLIELRDQLIEKGIKSAKERETGDKLAGALEGFEMCRVLSSVEDFEFALELQKLKEKEARPQRSGDLYQKLQEDTNLYWRIRYQTLQIELIYETLKVPFGGTSARAALRYAAIVGVKDPLDEFKDLGKLNRQKVLQAEGGMISIEEVRALIHGSDADITDLTNLRGLISVEEGGKRLFPKWQFDRKYQPMIIMVNNLLPKDIPDLETVMFFLEPTPYCDFLSPLEAIKAGQVPHAVRASQSYGKHV